MEGIRHVQPLERGPFRHGRPIAIRDYIEVRGGNESAACLDAGDVDVAGRSEPCRDEPAVVHEDPVAGFVGCMGRRCDGAGNDEGCSDNADSQGPQVVAGRAPAAWHPIVTKRSWTRRRRRHDIRERGPHRSQVHMPAFVRIIAERHQRLSVLHSRESSSTTQAVKDLSEVYGRRGYLRPRFFDAPVASTGGRFEGALNGVQGW